METLLKRLQERIDITMASEIHGAKTKETKEQQQSLNQLIIMQLLQELLKGGIKSFLFS